MTFFKLISGFDCGVDKSVCDLGYPNYCPTCISKKLSDANIEMNVIELVEEHSEQKRKEMLHKHIWRKYQDILNIRHIIILTRAGMPALNMAIGDLPINALLISGFIQANVAFSSEDLTLIDKINPEKEFYEFEYKNFLILLRNGKNCRICLIIDHKASNSLKELLSNFQVVFEDIYKDELKEFEEVGDLSLLDPAITLIEKSFEVSMKYPLTLSSKMLPSKIESLSLIQKAVYECCKELLKDESYFLIPTLIDTVIKLIGQLPKEEIFWNIYQLIRETIIIREKLEFSSQESEIKEKEMVKREHIIQRFMDKKELDEIFFECGDMSEEEALIKISSIFKKGEIAEKNAIYQESLKEYQKALIYAKEFNLDREIGKISYKIIEVEKLNKNIELKFAMDQANKSEKKREYVKALKYLFQITEILSAENDDGKHDKQMLKIDQRIKKIQNYFLLP
jgi:hypothetical protein